LAFDRTGNRSDPAPAVRGAVLWELPAAVPAVVEADPEIAADVEAEPGVVADEEVAASPDELHPATAATEAARSNAIITTRAGFKPRPSFIP
jgi:hypothetical protein